MPGVVPILHAGPGCAGNFAWTNNGSAGLNVTGGCLALGVPSTNLQESEVVFGGLDRLREEIVNARRIMEGSVFLVLTGCLPEVIGDDVGGLVDELAGRRGGLAHVSVPGFKGDSFLGYDEALRVIFEKVVPRSGKKRGDLVNVWGIPPTLDPFWRGNLDGLIGLLGLLGLKANVFFGPRASLAAVRQAGSAALNVVASGLYGIQAAESFRERHGVGFVQAPLPFGAGASDRFLGTVGRALGLPARRVRGAIEAAGRSHYQYLEPLIDVYNDMEAQRHALVIGDANYALAISDFLAGDLGWVPELVVITDDLSRERRESLLSFHREAGGIAPGRLFFGHRAGDILREARCIWPEGDGGGYRDPRSPIFVAGSSLDRDLAARLGAGHLSLSYPVANRAILSRGYTGYGGGLTLTEDLIGAFIAGR
jgi:nitrogenase molybdenum-iron protein beta chain